MPSIQITNTNTNLVITIGANVRTINKQVIREISILRGVTVKIDIGGGPLRNVFLPVADISVPHTADANSLLSALNDMLSPLDVQIESELGALTQTITDIQTTIDSLLPASMQEPSMIDESNENVIYTGFAAPGAVPSEASWAIMRSTIENDVISNDWADGSQHMTAVWDDRATLTYA